MKCKTIGPRGGTRMDDITCVTCAVWPGCGAATALAIKFGCLDWVDYEDGYRVAPVVIPAAAVEFMDEAKAKVDHIREALVDMLPVDQIEDPPAEPAPPCECGDPDCSQLNGHPIPEEESRNITKH
jgi:hypothetical protein